MCCTFKFMVIVALIADIGAHNKHNIKVLKDNEKNEELKSKRNDTTILELTEVTDDRSMLCDGFEANFNLKSIIGPWYVVAVIPGKNLTEEHVINCSVVEFSETDETGLRWLVNNTVSYRDSSLLRDIKGTIVRQRYHSSRPFDVWSMAVDGINGCFKQVLALDYNKEVVGNSKHVMQLHFLDTEESDPIVLQLLWGDLFSAVLYSKEQEITQQQLDLASTFMKERRENSKPPKMCKKLKEM